MLASEKGHVSVVNKLLFTGTDVNTTASDGLTALMIASMEGHVDVVKALLTAGASTDIK